AWRSTLVIPTVARLWMLALGVGVVAATIGIAIAGRKRRVLDAAGVAIAVLGALPLLYEGLVVAGVLRETFVRFERPQALVLLALLAVFVAVRLSRLPVRMGRGRRIAVALLSAIAALAAGLVVAGPELGKRLDRLAIVVALDRSRSIDLVPGAD